MFTIRIRYENLPEIVTRHQLYNLFYARSIQFVKDIIQQQQRYRTSRTLQKSNCASFSATRYVLFCPCEPSLLIGKSPNNILSSSLCIPRSE